jgi:hypothetical protein
MPVTTMQLTSSALRQAQYNSDTKTLTLTFANGRRYQYSDPVPEEIFQGLISAASAGSFYNANIRDVYS